MGDSQPKRCSYDELGGICNVPIADDAEFCENHVQKSRENTHDVARCLGIVILGYCSLFGRFTQHEC